MQKHPLVFTLFKGATRLPTVAGAPIIPLITMFIIVAAVSMLFSIWCWILALPSWLIMAQITRYDDRAFRILWLWFETKARNKNKAFWQGSSYGKADYRKASRR